MDISLGLIEGGAKVWLHFRPWRRLKVWRNKKRAAKGKPLLELSEDDMALFPKNTMRKTGVSVAALGPIIAIVLTAVGAPGECAAEAVAEGCVAASEIAGALVTILGGGLYVAGSIRADKRAAAEKPKE